MKRVLISALLAALATASVPALASGSGSGSGGGFGANNPFASGFPERDLVEQRGRAQVRTRITCKTCDYKDGVNKRNAGEVAEAVRSGKFELSEKDQAAVLHYLRKRYRV